MTATTTLNSGEAVPCGPQADTLTPPDFCRQSGLKTRPLRVLWIWHAAVVAEYQKPLALLARCPGLDMCLLVPDRWPERAGQMVQAEELPGAGFRMFRAPSVFTGLYFIYFFPDLLVRLLRLRPDIIYCYEEAHTFIAACVLAIRALFMPRTRVLLYAAQNIRKRYPPPFTMLERFCFRHADAILACGLTVARTLRSKGYRGELRVMPLPTDACAFAPDPDRRADDRRCLWPDMPEDALVVGYAGKLVEEKGLRTLWQAFSRVAGLRPDVHLALAGDGPLRAELQRAAHSAGLAERVHFAGVMHNTHLPAFMNALDVFVLPSETRRNWREQFGRVAVEAMACGVPVIGSDSGEIPFVLGEAGVVFPEGDAHALAQCLLTLLADPDRRTALAHAGRQRVLRLFALERVAARHYALYTELAGLTVPA